MAVKKRIGSPHVPEPPPQTWSNCLVVGDQVFVAGMIASDGGKILGGDSMYEQAKVIFGKIKHLMEAAGGRMDDIVKVQILTGFVFSPSAIALAPVVVITLRLGEFNLAQSVGTTDWDHVFERLGWHNLSLYPRYLVRFQLTAPVLALSVGGLLWALRKRDPRLLYFGLLILATYGFFTCAAPQEEETR